MNYIITKNKDDFRKIGNYNYCNLEDMVLPDVIAVDTETTGLNCLVDSVFCLQIGTGINNYLIDIRESKEPLFPEELIDFKDTFKYLKNKTLIFHNAAFDLGFFYEKEFYPSDIRDTMLASTILHNGDRTIFNHSLKSVFKRELNIELEKDEQKNIHITKLTTTRNIEYCFNDVDKLIQLHNVLIEKLAVYGSLETYYMNCNFVRAMTYLERCGLPIDQDYWKKKCLSDIRKSKAVADLIVSYIWEKIPKLRDNQLDFFDVSKKIVIKISSPLQMINVFEELKIPCVDDEGKKSISEKVINKTKHEFVDLWLDYQEAQHNVTTFGDNIINQIVNGRIYSRFKPIVDTNRMVSRKGGINFLNFPSNKETRDCFRSKPGYTMIVCDYSNQEVVCLTDLSNDSGLLDNIENKRDSHSKMAKAVYPEIADLSDLEVKNLHPEKRQIGKVVNFTVAFGGNGYTISKNLNTTQEEGENLYDAYKNLYEGVFKWGEETLAVALKVGYVESAMGFKLKLPFFDEFLKYEKILKSKDKQFWEFYRKGKEEYKKYWKSFEDKKKDNSLTQYVIQDDVSFRLYSANKKDISEFFKLKSSYFRLCLNNPCQATAAHQTKLATIRLFDYIVSNNLIDQVKLCNIIYDEIVLEVKDELVETIQPLIGLIMREEANKLLKSGLVKMEAEGNVGKSWYEAK